MPQCGLGYMRDVSPEYYCVYFCAGTGAVVLVFSFHLVILLSTCLCILWKFLVRLSYIAIIIYSSHRATHLVYGILYK